MNSRLQHLVNMRISDTMRQARTLAEKGDIRSLNLIVKEAFHLSLSVSQGNPLIFVPTV